MQELAFSHYLGLTTVSNVIRETTKVIWEVLQPVVLAEPTTEQWKKISEEFFNKWNIPNCFGAIDGKHIEIQAPFNAGSHFFNYKKTHSIVLMAVCDAYYRFILVDVGASGGTHDSIVFSDSAFGTKILNNLLPLPEPRHLPNTDILLPNFFIADAAFPLHSHIMRPFPGKHLSLTKKIYNYRISRARRTIENTFGILAQRWRVLRRALTTSLETCENIVLACVVLHNFIQRGEQEMTLDEKRYCPTGYVDEESANGVLRPGLWRRENGNLRRVERVGANNASRAVFRIRENLSEYFNSPEGGLSWQESYVMRGSVPPQFRMEMPP